MAHLLIFGMGYSARRIAALAKARGWSVVGTTRAGADGTLRFADADAVTRELTRATHVLSSVPPEGDGDPVVDRYGGAIGASRAWLGYLSSTGVYGDAQGAWVDETAALGGRRPPRTAADKTWLAMGARVFRLPGIYGPGRSALERVAAGTAHRVALLEQVFSRVHVDDLASGVVAGFDGPPGAYNLADDAPSSQDDVMAFAARLLGFPPPPVVALETLSPMARGFYAENRRVATGKARRVLGWAPRYADYRAGLRALKAIASPSPASTAPPSASGVQR